MDAHRERLCWSHVALTCAYTMSRWAAAQFCHCLCCAALHVPCTAGLLLIGERRGADIASPSPRCRGSAAASIAGGPPARHVPLPRTIRDSGNTPWLPSAWLSEQMKNPELTAFGKMTISTAPSPVVPSCGPLLPSVAMRFPGASAYAGTLMFSEGSGISTPQERTNLPHSHGLTATPRKVTGSAVL
jgi:hypothetical protein